MTDPLTAWLDEMERKARAASPEAHAHAMDLMVAERKLQAALPPETVQALLECVHGLERVLDYCRKYCGRADRCYTGEHHAAREAIARLRKIAKGDAK